MSDIIERSDVAGAANARIRARANSGISWGSNSYPVGSNAAWFAGPTTGVPTAMTASDIPAGETSANSTKVALRAFANLFGGVRLVRIATYKSHYIHGNVLQADGIGVANTVYQVNFANITTAPLTSITNMEEMRLDGLNLACEELYSCYLEISRNTPLVLTNTFCHTSCHSNCHCARGRR